MLLFLVCLVSNIAQPNYDKGDFQHISLQKDTSKSIIGKYNSPKQDFNKFTSEHLVLKNDSTFEYAINTEFYKIQAKGYWHVSASNLILNSEKRMQKIIVQEASNKSNNSQMKFDVTYKDNSSLYYQLFLITRKDTLYYKDVFRDTTINQDETLKAFYIVDSRGFRYPTYFLKSKKSNNFKIKLETDRIFDNEKWRISNDKLQPIGINGKYSSYYLIKEIK
ncbi:hypothetical protein DCM91_20890 [Chitinophaga costaii]|nr:hypothetical protein DCM91_20890 [Chitinophaga costaii]